MSPIYESVLISNTIGSDTAFTNTKAKLKESLDKVVPMLFQRRSPTFHQRCATLKISYPTSDFVSFSTSDQRYFNVHTQCVNNVDATLKCWLGLQKLFEAFMQSFIEICFQTVVTA